MQQIRRIDPLSAARVLGLVQAGLVFLVTAITLGISVISGTLPWPHDLLNSSSTGTVDLLLLNPLIAGAATYVFSLVIAVAYNCFAARFGGVRISITGEAEDV